MTYDEYKTENPWDGKLSFDDSHTLTLEESGIYYDAKEEEHTFDYEVTYSEHVAKVITYDVHIDDRKLAEQSVRDVEPEHIQLTFDHHEAYQD